jgi:hypothetical protein
VSSGFDRLRPRTPVAGPVAGGLQAPPDAAGKRALFSAAAATPTAGAISVDCARCGECTVLSAWRAARLLLPSLHLPVPGRRYPSLLRCPACRRFAWARLRLHL